MNIRLPVLVAKALADTGYDLVFPSEGGWVEAAISGTNVRVGVKVVDTGTLLAVSEPAMATRVGLRAVDIVPPDGMSNVGQADGAVHLYEALRVLHSLQTHPADVLSARVEARLAEVPSTERTREVRQRIGQDVFREALMDLWQGRCAVTGLSLPAQLLRASHAKPWAVASDMERLDPFNGLLLSVHLDAMFDSGLIAFGDEGVLLYSPQLDSTTRLHFGLGDGLRLNRFAPGHVPYLHWHREFVFTGE